MEREEDLRKRLIAVERALRSSTVYTEYLHRRLGPTPHLDDLHAAVMALLSTLRDQAAEPGRP